MTEVAERPATFVRFADPDAVDTIDLPGPCSCPDSPHEHDTATFRTQLGGGERESIAAAGYGRGTGDYFDWPAADSELITVATKSWTLLDAKGEPVPITFEVVHRRLDSARRTFLARAINAAHTEQLKAEAAQLPKASAARSRASSRANGSRTPTIRRKR